MNAPELFGYFKAEPFGWTDCAETDEGAQPLYEKATIDGLTKQIDELLSAAIKTLNENLHLCDGDNCTLIDLKRAVEAITGKPI